MTDLTDTLAKPIGPLPLGGWIVAGAGGIAVAVFIRRRGLSSELSDAQAQAASDAADNLGINGEGGLDNTQPGVGNQYQQPIYGDGEDTDVEKPTTNAAWRTRAVTVLSQNGYDGARAQRVMTDYIAGKTISSEDTQLVSAAIRLIGAPPDSIKQVPTVPNAAPGAPSRVFANNTEWRVAALKYLRERRHVSYKLSHDAIFKYLGLSPGALTAKEAAAVGSAITALGPPPTTPKQNIVKGLAATTNVTTSARRDVGTS